MPRRQEQTRGPWRWGMVVMGLLAGLCQAPAASAQELSVIKRVVIDPGHGGSNEGALGSLGHLEKDETLRIAVAIRDRLRRDHPRLEVVLTRTLDVDVGLGERCHVANALDADLFISLHLNSAPNPAASGVEVFYLATDKSMPLVTEGEGSWGQHSGYLPPPPAGLTPNDVERAPGEELATILGDLEQGRAHRDGAEFAGLLLQELVRMNPRVPSRGVRQANFGVLRGARMPAVVVEFGFLSNAVEERWLTSEVMRTRAAAAFSRALTRLDGVFQKRNYLASAGRQAPN